VYITTIAFEYIAGGTPNAGMIVLVRPDGTACQVAGDLKFPNGMVVTPDNSTLIISESFAGQLSAFDIEADGSLSNRRVWAEGLAPDAICLDADGAICALLTARSRKPSRRQNGGSSLPGRRRQLRLQLR
jgi:sugar lactone lactonase YvrE